MEALLHTYYKAKSATDNCELIFVPAQGKQSKLWWRWSCVRLQQTLFPNLLDLYTCDITKLPTKGSVALSVAATLTATPTEGSTFEFERHGPDTKLEIGKPAPDTLLFCTKEQYLELLQKLGPGKWRKCQSWVVPPQLPKLIQLRVKEEPGQKVADAVRLVTGTKLLGVFRTGTIRAVLRNEKLGAIMLILESPTPRVVETEVFDGAGGQIRLSSRWYRNANQAAWAAANILVDRTDGTGWEPVKFKLEAHTKLRQDVKCSDFRQCVDKLRESMTYRAHAFLKAVPQQFQSGAQRLIKAIIVEDFKRPEPVDGYNEMLVRRQTVDFLSLL